MHKKPIQNLLALLLGALLTLGYAPFSYSIVVPIALTAIFYIWLKLVDKKQAAWLGFSFGLGWFGAGISWVHVSIADFGGLPLIGSLTLMALLVSYLALFPALIFYCSTRYSQAWLQPFALAAFWVFFEWIRSWFLSGFPWLSLGYSQLDSLFTGWFPIAGETGVTFILVLSSALCAQVMCRSFNQSAFVITKESSFLLIVIISSLLVNRLEFSEVESEKVSIAMVQGNIEQELRWVPEQDIPTMKKYLYMTRELWHNQIIIWPEAAVPRLEPLALDYLTQVDDEAFSSDTGLVTGIANYNFTTTEAHNALIVLGKFNSAQTEPQYQYLHQNRYAKHHLLPIGEFIPLESWLRGLAPIFDLPMSSFSRGDYEQASLLVNNYRLLSAICFEIAFPRQIRANLRSNTDFILTVSNDAWFGASHGPAQHLEIAQVRAAEFGIPVLRATNNGITAFIDHRGKVIKRAPQFEAASIETELARVGGITPYRWYGDWPLWVLVSVIFMVVGLSYTRRSQSAN